MNSQMQPEGATCVCSRSFRTHLLTSKIIISPPLRSTSDRPPRRAPRLLPGCGRPGRLGHPPGRQRPGRPGWVRGGEPAAGGVQGGCAEVVPKFTVLSSEYPGGQFLHVLAVGAALEPSSLASGHTSSNTPGLIRTRKLSGERPG